MRVDGGNYWVRGGRTHIVNTHFLDLVNQSVVLPAACSIGHRHVVAVLCNNRTVCHNYNLLRCSVANLSLLILRVMNLSLLSKLY